MEATTILLFCFTLFFILITSAAVLDTLSATENRTIVDGDVIESVGGVFQMGFFSPGISNYRYLGIWYKKTGPVTVLWAANRENPLTDLSGVLKIDNRGALLLMNARNTIIWSTKPGQVKNPVAQLLESGNLVVRDENNTNSDGYLWQSFDHPGDALLPGMKLGWDLVKGHERKLTSWRSDNDPSPGKYSLSISLDGYPQLVLQSGSVLKYRLGSWDGMPFNSMSTSTQSKDLTDKFVMNQNEKYYNYGKLELGACYGLMSFLTLGACYGYCCFAGCVMRMLSYFRFPNIVVML
ncbi:G-type lectin S-receptor-like serine/threonine-protein kinase [Heracleum sosnowskyi]|uniref:G-type lectin S-receptor-like serine/threonine-protein kinase n=1 Tax=Heracleum sosnowskyi TaxID=360622 RepID=A0AAD8HZ63_9APIA|nr:G-type lectin S-receptor-like serine/threonine-protein kinase [Heracleum sosnowskyi]